MITKISQIYASEINKNYNLPKTLSAAVYIPSNVDVIKMIGKSPEVDYRLIALSIRRKVLRPILHKTRNLPNQSNSY